MITGFILTIFVVVLEFIVGFMPIVPFPSEITDAWVTMWGYINGLSWLFPVGTLISVLTIGVLFQVSMWGWHMLHVVASYVRGR